MCNKDCTKTACPFAYTDESETIQNYGCLPTPLEIVAMRVIHGKTWACHSDNSKPCVGGLKEVRKKGFDNCVIDNNLITESNLTKELLTYKDEDFKMIYDREREKYREDNNLCVL
jgi:hypothetical protein